MGILCFCAAALSVATPFAGAQQPEPAQTLVREVVYNELQDHNHHGFWHYWIQRRLPDSTQLEEQVETNAGPIKWVVETNGQPVNPETRTEERNRLQHLVNSPREQAAHLKEYSDDEKRLATLVGMLPYAYLFEYAGEENGCHRLRFRPNPEYSARTIEARVMHAMAGDVWIDARMKRLSRLEGHLGEDVDFGFGLLGHLDKGGWFRMQRVQVSPSEWKTQHLELHLSGRAILFKTIDRDTNEVRGGFAAVPAGLNLAQGLRILEQTDPLLDPTTVALISPAPLFRRPQ